jgi:hypothetical protein
MSIEIIGTGYHKNVEIGEKFLQESVVNMWDSVPTNVFTYYYNIDDMIIRKVLHEVTKTSVNGYSYHVLTIDEITDEIKNKLIEKGNKL